MTQTYYAPSHQAEFLRTLFSHLTDSLIELRFINGEHRRQVFYEDVEAVIQALPELLQQHEGYNVYIGVCPRSEKDGTKRSIKCVQCLWQDFDAKDFRGGKDEILQRLRDFPFPPTLTVDSGHGYHCYWCFKEAEAIQSPADIDRIEGFNRRLATLLGGDPVAVDLARVLRLAGTVNHKDPRQPVPVRVIELEASRQYNLSDFDDFLPALESPAHQAILTNPKGWVAEILGQLHDGKRDDCHNVFTKLTGKFLQAGLGAADIKTLLKPHLEDVAHDGHAFTSEKLDALIDDMCRRYPSSQEIATDEAMDFAPVSLGELAEPPPRVDLVEGLLPEGYITVLYGDGGMGKSYLALAIATCVALEKRFLGRGVKPTGVLYLDWEVDQNEAARRAFQIARGMGLERPPMNIWYEEINQPLSAMAGKIKAYIEERGVGVVIIDSLGLACADDPEAARVVIKLFSMLKGLRTTILGIDHQSKLNEGQHYGLKSPFGSVYKGNLSRSVIQIQKVEGSYGQLALLLHHKKFNFGHLNDDMGVRLHFEGNVVRLSQFDPKTEPAAYQHLSARQKVEQEMPRVKRATKKQLAELTGEDPDTVGNELSKLHQRGKIREADKDGHATVWEWVESHQQNGSGGGDNSNGEATNGDVASQ